MSKTVLVQDHIEKNMMEYGAYIILSRALPDFRDGMLPVNRRILYTMDLEDATKFTKSANIEGAVMKLHPHGSSYGVMVNMVQKDRNQTPLIIGKGNFGQATSRDLQEGASRYTEVKLAPIAIEMMKNLKKNLVDFVPNYDGSIMQPEVLPVKFPYVLMRPSNGVALGMASQIPSFNMKELAKAIIKYLKENVKTLLVPDFATGGYIVKNKDVFKQINLEGRGSIFLRGKAEIKGNKIEITEIPYTTTREAIIEKIVDLYKSGKMKEISDVKDLTGLKGMNIEVSFKRGTDMNKALEVLYQTTPLQSSFSANMNVIIDKGPKVMGAWQIIEEWLKWRRQTITRGYLFDIAKMKKDLHFLRGLEKVLLDIDKAIEIIRRSADDLIEKNLMDHFKIDESQASAIADMKLRNINKDYIIKRIAEISSLEEKIKDYEDIAQSDERKNEIIIKELTETSEKYGVDRATKIIEVNTEKVKAVKKEMEAVPDYPVKIYITKEGYVRKSIQFDADTKSFNLKPGDELVTEYSTRNSGELLVFGADKCCYKIKISEIDEVTTRQLGVFIPSLCEVKTIVGTSVIDGKNKFIIIGYNNNKIAKIKLDSFNGNRKKLANSLAKNNDVVGILTFSEEGKFKFKTTTTSFVVPTSKFELKERWTQGVAGPMKGVLKEIEMI
jgi:DNA gyrase subunit A